MKSAFLSIVLMLFMLFVYAANTFAQDISRWHLPEGAKARLGKGDINEIGFSPDGERLAVAGSIGIWLYNAKTGQELDLLARHIGWVSSVAFSPDGKNIASGNWKTILLWDANTGEYLRAFTGHEDRVNSIAFSPDGKNIASGSYDGTVLIWELAP